MIAGHRAKPMRAPDRFRFRPPAIEFDRETRWCLLRAFGPADQAADGTPLDPTRAVEIANALDVAARIATRIPLATLQAELGPDAARQLLIAQALTRARTDRVLALAREVATVLGALDVHGVLLKGVALVATGIPDPGSRAISDLDVLVARETVPALQAALVERGFASWDIPAQEHHATPLSRGSSDMVEIHTALLGLRLAPRGPWASLAALASGGRLAPLEGWPAAIAVPDRDVMIAHVLAHGLAQHGLAPDKYPLARMLQDLVDLGFDRLDSDGLDRVGATVAGDVSIREVRAARDLCAALAGGEPLAAYPGTGDARQLLGHVIAGALDQGYVKALRLRSMLEFPNSGVHGVIRTLKEAFVLTRGQVDGIYGRQTSWLGYALFRIWRPFDLVRRTLLYGWRALMQHR